MSELIDDLLAQTTSHRSQATDHQFDLFSDFNGIPNLSTQANFNQWYDTVANVNLTIHDELPLTQQPGGSFVFDSAVDFATGQFTPLNGRGWNVSQTRNGVAAIKQTTTDFVEAVDATFDGMIEDLPPEGRARYERTR